VTAPDRSETLGTVPPARVTIDRAYDVYSDSGLGGFATPEGSAAYASQYEINYARHLPENRGTTFLDVGCGAGNYLGWLRGKGYDRLFGVDLSEVAVRHCRERGFDGVERVQDLVVYLDARRAAYDVISMNDVIEHFSHEELLPTLEAILRALRPGGSLLVKTLNMGNIGGLYMRYNDFTHRLGFTETSVKQALLAAGFHRVDVLPYGVPTTSARGRVWSAVGGLWRRVFGTLLLLDVGIDRPRVLSKTLLAVAYAPTGESS